MQSHRPYKAAKRVPPEARIIRKNLRNLRRRAGLSQVALGRRIDVSFQQVQKYENGQNRLPLKNFTCSSIFTMCRTKHSSQVWRSFCSAGYRSSL